MLKTNWQVDDTYTPSEMNATEQEIKANDTAVTNHISNENNPQSNVGGRQFLLWIPE